MFGIVGKLVGGVAGGLLDKVGLGKIAPFVKTGLNLLTGNWLGVAKDVFSLVSGFKGNPLDKATKNPPLGGFEQGNLFAGTNNSNAQGCNHNPFNGNQNSIDGSRMTDLLKALSQLFRALARQSDGGGNNNGGGLRRIFDAFRTLGESFGNNQLYNNRVSISQFTNIRM